MGKNQISSPFFVFAASEEVLKTVGANFRPARKQLLIKQTIRCTCSFIGWWSWSRQPKRLAWHISASHRTRSAQLTVAEIKSMCQKDGMALGGRGNQKIWAGEEENIWDSKKVSGACEQMGCLYGSHVIPMSCAVWGDVNEGNTGRGRGQRGGLVNGCVEVRMFVSLFSRVTRTCLFHSVAR